MSPLFWLICGMVLSLGLAILSMRFIGFRTQTPTDFVGKGPQFDLRKHLTGPILCEGVIYGPTGRVTSRFVADMEATWNGNHGVMTEQFHYDSGAVQNREWTLVLGNDGSIKATAPDVVGEGRGQAEGPAVQMEYRIRMDASAGGHVLDVTDWMYLSENGTIMNRSQFRKFGFKVAELVATMRKKES